MPTTKAKKTVKAIKPLRSIEVSTESVTTAPKNNNYSLISKIVIIALFGTFAYLVASKYRGLILAGTVNNYPISRYELNSKMAERYGKQTLEEIVNEKILNDQIKKNGISVPEEEVNSEMEKMSKPYGNPEAFRAALEQFGLTEEKAKQSVRQSLGFKKLIEKNYKIEVTEDAIKSFYEENKKTTYKDKKIEEVSAEIKDRLYQQELYAKSQEMFSNIRKEAKVSSFI